MYNPGSDNYSESRIISFVGAISESRPSLLSERSPGRDFPTETCSPVRMGETRYEPIQCFAIKDYYRLGKRYDRLLTLPPLANPWTGKPMQKTLFDTE